MKKFMFVGLAAFLLCISATAFRIQAQAKPDLIVSRVGITKDASGLFVEKISVTVTNACRETEAATSYVLVTFRQNAQKDAKAIFYVGNTVKALRGGESHTQTFDVSQKKIGVGRHVYVEADPYKKISEASEDNNWRTLFPDGAGTLPAQARCSPK
ncbi:MAG TPA: CARDB domain-containing protein [Pyrinomonadaceae bacterium]|nr:CARDB domain-containing protein [Pyrinomonadaceae bacterium]